MTTVSTENAVFDKRTFAKKMTERKHLSNFNGKRDVVSNLKFQPKNDSKMVGFKGVPGSKIGLKN